MATHPFDMSMSLEDLWYYVTKQAKDKNALIDRMIKKSYKINSLQNIWLRLILMVPKPY